MQHLKTKLEAAIKRRKTLFGDLEDTNAYRLVNSAGDGMPGVTIDRLGRAYLLELHRRDIAPDPILATLSNCLGLDTPVFSKDRWAAKEQQVTGRQVLGLPCSPDIVVKERGLKFSLNLVQSEHVGLFLDSRPARERVEALAMGRRVLNLFSYTGGFGVAASRGQARSVTNIDNKSSALNRARENFSLNGLKSDTRSFLKSDAVKFLAHAAKRNTSWNLIILDPPPASRGPGGRVFRVETGYAPLAGRCIKRLSPDGLILAGLNAPRIDDARFDEILAEAGRLGGRKLKTVEHLGPGPDFPHSPDRPTARFRLLRVN
jgi:23S rRNA (cytosine1962-C5)-methyltransferase